MPLRRLRMSEFECRVTANNDEHENKRQHSRCISRFLDDLYSININSLDCGRVSWRKKKNYPGHNTRIRKKCKTRINSNIKTNVRKGQSSAVFLLSMISSMYKVKGKVLLNN